MSRDILEHYHSRTGCRTTYSWISSMFLVYTTEWIEFSNRSFSILCNTISKRTTTSRPFQVINQTKLNERAHKNHASMSSAEKAYIINSGFVLHTTHAWRWQLTNVTNYIFSYIADYRLAALIYLPCLHCSGTFASWISSLLVKQAHPRLW